MYWRMQMTLYYWEKLNRNKTTFYRNGKHCQKARTTDKPRKNKIYDSGKEKRFKTKNRTFENKKLQI